MLQQKANEKNYDHQSHVFSQDLAQEAYSDAAFRPGQMRVEQYSLIINSYFTPNMLGQNAVKELQEPISPKRIGALRLHVFT